MEAMKEIDLQPLDYDLAVIEIPVKIGGKEFLLREASGEVHRNFTNARTNSLILGPNKSVVGYKNIADLDSFLVSLCLVELVRGEDDSVIHERPTQLEQIRSWPGRIGSDLYDKARKISKIDEDKTLEALLEERKDIDEQIETLKKRDEIVKNLENDTTDGST